MVDLKMAVKVLKDEMTPSGVRFYERSGAPGRYIRRIFEMDPRQVLLLNPCERVVLQAAGIPIPGE